MNHLLEDIAEIGQLVDIGAWEQAEARLAKHDSLVRSEWEKSSKKNTESQWRQLHTCQCELLARIEILREELVIQLANLPQESKAVHRYLDNYSVC